MSTAHGPIASEKVVAQNRRTNKLILVVVAIGVLGLVGMGATAWVLQTRTNHRLTAIAQENHANGEQVKEAVRILTDVTGPEAQKRQAEQLAGIVDGLRRSTDCSTSFAIDTILRAFGIDPGDNPEPACSSVDQRNEAIRDGQDPFAAPGRP